jgi:uncharacterized protein involved in exopolysaccharide biosynthesis
MRIKPFIPLAILFFLITGGITYLITHFFITPKYESTAVIYTPNTHANIHLVSTGIRFGYDKEIGEQLEILGSVAVREQLISEFNLLEAYAIDTIETYWQEKLQSRYNRNIALNRTVNKSIEVTVRDEHPEQAAAMANRLVALADEHKSAVVKGNVKLAAEAALKSYEEKSAIIALMTDSLEALRQAGESVWTYGEERKSGRYQNYELQYRKELERYMELKQRWEELDDLLQAEIPRSYVVSAAIPASQPVYPKKALLSLLVGSIAAIAYLVIRNLKSH